jgi:uncharacterized membrane protein YedE/YeeE
MVAKPYANPYAAGIALGLVLLACFALTGQGLSASGAFAAAASGAVDALAPRLAAQNSYFQGYLQTQTAAIVAQVAAVIAGGAVSACLNGRWRLGIERGPHVGGMARLFAAGAGGMLLGLGAMLARGCTSGQALSGGALLSVGSWAFMIAVFASAYATMPSLGRLWR